MGRYFGDKWPEYWSYRPWEPENKVAILDANVMMDVALISQSAGASALEILQRWGYSFVTTEQAKAEVFKTLADYRRGLPSIDPIFSAFLDAEVRVLPSANSFPGISKQDAHLASLAAELQGLVVTEDVPFIEDADAAGIHARTLREILLSWPGVATSHLSPLAYGTSFGADGHIFAKATADQKTFLNDREYNLFASPGLGRLAFDSGRAAFRFFDCNDRLVCEAPFQLESDRQFAALLEYTTGRKTAYTIKIGWVSKDEPEAASASAEWDPLASRPTSEVRWLNRYDKPEGWVGTLSLGTFGPHRLARDQWRACRRIVGVAPSTLTSNMSLAAALLCEVRGNGFLRPRWQDLRSLFYVTTSGFYRGARLAERQNPWFDFDEED